MKIVVVGTATIRSMGRRTTGKFNELAEIMLEGA